MYKDIFIIKWSLLIISLEIWTSFRMVQTFEIQTFSGGPFSLDFKWCLKTRPLDDRTDLDHLNTWLVRYWDVHCLQITIKCPYVKRSGVDFLFIGSWAQFLTPKFFLPFWGQIVELLFSWLLRPTFYRTLWTVKVDFRVKKLGEVALNYLYIQEIDPWWN
jgi:hypothetical protein